MKFVFACIIVCHSVFFGQFKIKYQSPESVPAQLETVIVNNDDFLQVRWQAMKDDIRYGVRTGEKILSNFSNSETLQGVGLSALVIGAASLLDNEMKLVTQRNQSSFGTAIAKIDDYYGSGKTLYGIGAVYLIGLAANDNTIRRVGAELLTASAYTGLFTGVIKYAVGRHRPKTGDAPYTFSPFSTSFEQTSFLSGHTSWTFAVSTVMAEQNDNIYWKIGWYAVAGVVGYARMYHNVHWFSDVVAGALLGYSIGKLSSDVSKNSVNKVVVAPAVQPSSISFIFPL